MSPPPAFLLKAPGAEGSSSALLRSTAPRATCVPRRPWSRPGSVGWIQIADVAPNAEVATASEAPPTPSAPDPRLVRPSPSEIAVLVETAVRARVPELQVASDLHVPLADVERAVESLYARVYGMLPCQRCPCRTSCARRLR